MPGPPPTKFNPDFHPSSYLKLCKEGKLKVQICAQWEICRDTLWKWEKNEKRLADVLKRGDAHREDQWVKKGIEFINGENPKGNAGVYIFFMKNCFAWTDKQDVSLGIQEDKTLIVDLSGSITREEIARSKSS